MNKAQTHRRNVVQLYLDNLRKEEKKPDTRGERGRAKDARRRAMDITAEMCGYSSYTGVARYVRAWEDANVPVNFDTMGMELDQEFGTIIRERQYKVSMACHATRELAKEVKELMGRAPELEVLEKELLEEYPRCLCPFCKGAVDKCEECDGQSWLPEMPTSQMDPRLSWEEDIHVVYEDEVVPLGEVPQ